MNDRFKFRALTLEGDVIKDIGTIEFFVDGQIIVNEEIPVKRLIQCTGLKDKNGVLIYEGDIVGEEGVYHFIEREGWKPSSGKWKIIGEKSKNFTGKKEEKYIAGYELKTVIWEDSSCGFEPFSDNKDNCGHCGGRDIPQKKVVLGNIYENPELLTPQK